MHSQSRNLPLLLQFETAAFLLGSMADTLMTCLLLQNDAIYEANPVARFFLNEWGYAGMVSFKAFMVTFICAITQVIAYSKPSYSRRILKFGAFVMVCVVTYSCLIACFPLVH